MSRQFHPLLSSKIFSNKPGEFEKNVSKLVFPLLGSWKYDGWRLFEYAGSPHTRSLVHPKNYHTVNTLTQFYDAARRHSTIRGIDGEALAGPIFHPNAMQHSTSAFGSYGGCPEFTYLVFDTYQCAEEPYEKRLDSLRHCLDREFLSEFPWVQIVEQRLLRSWDEVLEFEAEAALLGAEGIMLRRPDARYKMGRSSINDGGILAALKRFVDSEAIILEVHEMLENTNPLTEDNFGRSKRSSHQAGMVPKGTFGHAVCRDPKFSEPFRVGMGPGLDDAMRKWLWDIRASLPGEPLNYSYLEVGCKDRPRHPKWRGLRGRENMPLSR